MTIKNHIFILFLLCLSITGIAQENNRNFANTIIPGASVTYVRYSQDDSETKFHETVYHANVSTDVFPNIYVGLSYMDIRNRTTNPLNSNPIKDNYYMAGIFAQYDFLGESKNRLLGELSYHYGNYCYCGKDNPFESNGLSYFGFGGAYDMHLYKGIYLDTGFNVYTIVNKREKKDIFAQYILGINYHFGL